MVCSLGRADRLDEEGLERVGRSILEVVKESRQRAGRRHREEGGRVEIEWSKPLGEMYFARQLWLRLGMDSCVGKLSGKRRARYEAGVFLLAADRLVHVSVPGFGRVAVGSAPEGQHGRRRTVLTAFWPGSWAFERGHGLCPCVPDRGRRLELS